MTGGANSAGSNGADNGSAVPKNVDILVRNAYVITMDSERRVYPSGALAIEGTAIVALGPDREVVPLFRPARTINAHGAPVHPGFVDNHTHVCLHNMRWASPEVGNRDERAARQGKSYWDLCVDETEYAGSRLASLEMARKRHNVLPGGGDSNGAGCWGGRGGGDWDSRPAWRPICL